MIAESKGHSHRVTETKQIDNVSARAIMNQSELMVSKLIKKKQLPADISIKLKTIFDSLEPLTQPDVIRYAQNLKLDDYERQQILNYSFTSEAKLLLILPGLERLSSKELSELVKIKRKYLPH